MKLIAWLLVAASLLAAAPAQSASDWQDTSKKQSLWGY